MGWSLSPEASFGSLLFVFLAAASGFSAPSRNYSLYLKGLSGHLNLRGVTRLIQSGIIKGCPASFYFYFNNSLTRGALKHWQQFKDFWDGFVQSKSLTGAFQSPESQFKNRPNPKRWLTKNGQIPEDDLQRLAKSRLMTSWNLESGFDDTSRLKPYSGDEWLFQLGVSRNGYRSF